MSQQTPYSVTMKDPEANEGRQIGRRALIAAAGLGAVGVVVAETPNILDGARKLTEAEITNAINLGRQQLAEELANLEGIVIDDAIDAAQVAHGAVQNFVLPIVSLLAALTGVTLDAASAAVEKAQQFTQLLNIDLQSLATLDGIIKAWRGNVATFPTLVASVNNTDTQSAELYLTKLKEKLKQDAARTPK